MRYGYQRIHILLRRDGWLVNHKKAGRCISGDFVAHSSYRVTGNAVPMGEAAGRAAAVSAAKNVMPHELDWREIASA